MRERLKKKNQSTAEVGCVSDNIKVTFFGGNASEEGAIG